MLVVNEVNEDTQLKFQCEKATGNDIHFNESAWVLEFATSNYFKFLYIQSEKEETHIMLKNITKVDTDIVTKQIALSYIKSEKEKKIVFDFSSLQDALLFAKTVEYLKKNITMSLPSAKKRWFKQKLTLTVSSEKDPFSKWKSHTHLNPKRAIKTYSKKKCVSLPSSAYQSEMFSKLTSIKSLETKVEQTDKSTVDLIETPDVSSIVNRTPPIFKKPTFSENKVSKTCSGNVKRMSSSSGKRVYSGYFTDTKKRNKRRLASTSVLDPTRKLNFSATKQKIPSKNVNSTNGGLLNSANTCYVNCILQQISHMRPFCLKVKEIIQRARNKQLEWDKMFACCRMILHVASHVHNATQGQNVGAIDISRARVIVAEKSGVKYYKDSRQQDAHEFLQHLLEVIEKETGRELINQFFGSIINVLLKCNNCDYTHESNEVYLNISLIMPNIKVNQGGESELLRLDRLVEHFFLPSPVNFKCEKCNEVGGVQHSKVTSFPQYLILHVKRFLAEYDGVDIKFRKRNGRIIPVTTLNIFDQEYALTGIVFHIGEELHEGHYTSAIVSGKENDRWVYYNDSIVKEVPVEDVISNATAQRNSYIYFLQARAKTI